MEKEQAIQKIMKLYDVNNNVACELFLIYRKRGKLRELEILLNDIDLDEQPIEKYE